MQRFSKSKSVSAARRNESLMVPPFVSSRAATAQGTLIALDLLSLGYRYIINRVILSSVPESAARPAVSFHTIFRTGAKALGGRQDLSARAPVSGHDQVNVEVGDSHSCGLLVSSRRACVRREDRKRAFPETWTPTTQEEKQAQKLCLFGSHNTPMAGAAS
jgi:hypothetical protein